MHRHGAKRKSWVVVTIVLSFLTGCKRHAEQQTPSPKTAQPGDIWVSETTGKEYRVRVENDVVHTEWLNVSPELAKHGAFIRSECKKQGTKWVGTSTSYLPCTTQSGPKPNFDNWCHLETEFEVDAITPENIVGRSPALIKFDCMKCQILQSEMRDFHWSPKDAIPKE